MTHFMKSIQKTYLALLFLMLSISGFAQKSNTTIIKAGKKADIIAVITNPIDDITILEQVQFVMKNGVVYKNN